MTQTMRAILARAPGGPEVMTLEQVPLPQPGRGEVRVRVAASGLNRGDLVQRLGKYPAPPGWPPHILGLEFAGTVDALGEGAEAKIGDRVMGLVGGGGYAEAVVVHARELVPVPAGMSLQDAGAVPEVFLTAFDALFQQMELVLGETLLIHAVGSGVGSAALQLALAAGARVIGTSRTPDKLTRAAELGLEHGIVAGEGDWAKEVLAATGGRGADVILDLVGAPYLAGNTKAIATSGRMIVVGVTGGPKSELDLRALMSKRASITGTVLRSRPIEEKIALARAFADQVVPLFEAGRLEPVVDAFFRPENVADAHRRLEASDTFGKLVLLWE